MSAVRQGAAQWSADADVQPASTRSEPAIRVAFTPIGGARWTGGRSWQLNLFRSTMRHERSRVQPVLFCGNDLPADDAAQFATIEGLEMIRAPAFEAGDEGRRLVRALVSGVDREAVELFVQHRISVVFESATFYGWRCPLPTIAWLPDFQHRRLRGQFGAAARCKREIGFRAQVASRRRIMLSSEDARADCERYYPASTGRTSVVRFAAPIEDASFESDPLATARRYGLPPTFVFLPNQFWKHKNHSVVIEAISLLREQGIEVTVAASGNPSDPRHPGHYESLRRRVETLGLVDRFRFLGMIPRAHLVSLMRTCTLLVNPSFFEGWSTTVEEARTLGAPLLLSDIGVHREQMGDEALYFDPHDASSLAARIREALEIHAAPCAPRSPAPGSDASVCRFAADFAAVVEAAARTSGAKKRPRSRRAASVA